MQIQPTVGHKGLKKILEQAEIEGLNLSIRQIDVVHEIGTPTQINRHLREGFIQWDRGESESLDPRLFTQRLVQDLPHDNPDILYGVVFVDFDIALGLNRQVEETMLGEKIEHVRLEDDVVSPALAPDAASPPLAPAGEVPKIRAGGGP